MKGRYPRAMLAGMAAYVAVLPVWWFFTRHAPGFWIGALLGGFGTLCYIAVCDAREQRERKAFDEVWENVVETYESPAYGEDE